MVANFKFGSALRMSRIASSIVLAVWAAPFARSQALAQHEKLLVDGRAVHYDVFASPSSPAIVILLHGSTGPSAIEQEARVLAQQGISAVVLHYFDAAKHRQPDDQDYIAWVKAVDLLVAHLKSSGAKPSRVILYGVSLGASVALAAGSQLDGADAVVDWSGSLPDYFFAHLRGMPPLLIIHGQLDQNVPVANALQLAHLCQIAGFQCRVRIFPNQGHMFVGDALGDATALVHEFIAQNSASDGTHH